MKQLNRRPLNNLILRKFSNNILEDPLTTNESLDGAILEESFVDLSLKTTITLTMMRI